MASRTKRTNSGYGNDPNLITPSRTWPLTLSRDQRRIIAILADIILPGTAEHPAPSKIGIVDFFDEWLSAPYSTQQKDKAQIIPGFAMVDAEAHRLFGAEFLELKPKQRLQIVDGLASPTNHDRKFFVKFRSLLAGGYFTSDTGLRAIGYIGNVPLQSFPGVPPEVRRIIEARLKNLGL